MRKCEVGTYIDANGSMMSVLARDDGWYIGVLNLDENSTTYKPITAIDLCVMLEEGQWVKYIPYPTASA